MAQPRFAEAKRFAIEAHGDQKYDGKPYIVHLVAVAREFRVDNLGEEYTVAGFLHDVVEDTDVELGEITKEFGPRVAELVAAVTCVKGLSRREKFQELYPRVRSTPGAVLVKLCDRIANVRHSLQGGGSLLKMYQKEYEEFRAQLMDPADPHARPLWSELDRLLQVSDQAQAA